MGATSLYTGCARALQAIKIRAKKSRRFFIIVSYLN
jgi:hypothetical protein